MDAEIGSYCIGGASITLKLNYLGKTKQFTYIFPLKTGEIVMKSCI